METTRTSTTTHFYVGEAQLAPLRCDHESGETSFRLVEGVWFTGNASDWRAFATLVATFADELTRSELGQFTDQDDFDQSRADHEVLL